MKTFKDLEFKSSPAGRGLQAIMMFPNGYGVSVIRFKSLFGGGFSSYTNDDTEWELAVFHGNPNDPRKLEICYATPLTDDVLGHLTEEQVTEVMQRVQELPEDEACSHARKAS